MTREELQQHFLRLDLHPDEAALLLDVAGRTVRRWLIEGETIPGPAEQAVLAWVRLHDAHLPWRPDAASIVNNDQRQIAIHRAHAVEQAAMLERVESRGGPKVSWDVDLATNTAQLGPIRVSFYRLQNGGFSLANYRRTDGLPDPERDAELIDDAAYCIAKTLKKLEPNFGPVTVFYQDGPAKNRTAKQQSQDFRNVSAAMRYVCQKFGSAGFHDPFITTKSPTELLWDHHELKRECARVAMAPRALSDLAAYVHKHAGIFVQDGPKMLSPAEFSRREESIRALATEIDALATKAGVQSVHYPEFDRLLGQLHALGFFPPMQKLSDVARALVVK